MSTYLLTKSFNAGNVVKDFDHLKSISEIDKVMLLSESQGHLDVITVFVVHVSIK